MSKNTLRPTYQFPTEWTIESTGFDSWKPSKYEYKVSYQTLKTDMHTIEGAGGRNTSIATEAPTKKISGVYDNTEYYSSMVYDTDQSPQKNDTKSIDEKISISLAQYEKYQGQANQIYDLKNNMYKMQNKEAKVQQELLEAREEIQKLTLQVKSLIKRVK